MTDLHSLLDPSDVRSALVGRVTREPGRLELLRAWPYDGVGVSALYRDASSGRLWPVLRPAHTAESTRLARAVSRGDAFRIRELEAYGLVFPRDPSLPALPALATTPLSESSELPLSLQEAGRQEGRLLRYKPLRRCVWRLGTGHARRYVKCLRPRHAERVAANYELLSGAPGLTIAAPESVWPDLGIIAWRAEPGEPLAAMLAGDEGESVAAAAGRTLGALHRSPRRLPAVHSPGRELETLLSWVQLAASAAPERGAEIRRVAADLASRGARLPAGPLLPAHRDFHEGQILTAGSKAVLLDLDTAAHAEPELDIGNFLAHLALRREETSVTETGDLAAAFMAGYESAGTAPIDDGRLDWYYDCSLVRLACVHVPRPGGHDVATRLLDRVASSADRLKRTEVMS